MKILDCTLRDGGYYNAWDFSELLVDDYLSAISQSGVEYVELGLRNFPKNDFLGAFAYTSEEYLNSLTLAKNINYGVMVDAKTILSSGKPIDEAIKELFVEKQNSKILLVRIASYFQDVEASKNIAIQLKELGYMVGFNLMQAGGKSTSLIKKKTNEIASWDAVDVLYFADSLGNMTAEEVRRVCVALRETWNRDLGIHTHNNMGRALDNSLVAIEEGISWLDSTVAGMGRGAGNTPTEKLLSSLNNDSKQFSLFPLYEVVIKHFEPLKHQYGWGDNLLYFLGAQHNVHPTYIQNMLSNSHLGKDELVASIKFLINEDDTNKYDGKLLEIALSLSNINQEPKGDVLGPVFINKEILIITNAPGIERHKRAIELYIKKHNPIVIGINLVDKINESLFDYFCISHNLKFLSDYDKYQSMDKPIICPKHRFKQDELELLKSVPKILDYGVKIERDTFLTSSDSCVIPYDLTIAYALAASIEGQAKRILFAGLDGYSSKDERQLEMIEVFQSIQEASNSKDIEFIAITPTSYPIAKGSVYAML